MFKSQNSMYKWQRWRVTCRIACIPAIDLKFDRCTSTFVFQRQESFEIRKFLKARVLYLPLKSQMSGYIHDFERYGYDMNFQPKWDIISYLISQISLGYYIISKIPIWDIISDMIWKRYEKIYIFNTTGWQMYF